MKTQLLLASFLFFSIFSFAQTTKQNIKVSGSCGMCKKHIETAAKEAGATAASWNKDTKILTVSFDTKKTSNKKIQEKVAAAGYDTPDFSATEEAYKKLDECCQYDRTETKKAATKKSTSMNCCDPKKDCCKQGSSCCAK